MHDSPAARRRVALRRSRGLLFGLALLAFPVSGRALGIEDITPLYFAGPGGEGFSPTAAAAVGRSAAYSATFEDLWLRAGDSDSGLPIEIDQVQGPTHPNPPQPSTASPVIVDSAWTVRNQSGQALTAPLLVFTRVDPLGLYPIALPPTGLDADLLSLLSYSSSGASSGADFLYGAIRLPDLAPGAAANVSVRYVVAGELASGSPPPLPPLGVAVAGSYSLVPEPATAALLCVGLGALAAASRSRRR